MIKLEDQLYKYQALAALAAAANYSSLMSSSFGFKRAESFDQEPKSKRFKEDQAYSDMDSTDEDEDRKETTNEEEIDVGNEQFCDEQKCHNTPKKSSFFISDILGLESTKPQVKIQDKSNLVEQFIQNYQQQLQRTFDICRLVSINSSPEKQEKKEVHNDSASILSSLEKLAKSQLEEQKMPSKLATNSEVGKKSDKKENIVKKYSDSVSEREVSSEKKTNAGMPTQFPAWVYCTRYSDRPSAGKPYQFQLSVRIFYSGD